MCGGGVWCRRPRRVQCRRVSSWRVSSCSGALDSSSPVVCAKIAVTLNYYNGRGRKREEEGHDSERPEGVHGIPMAGTMNGHRRGAISYCI